MGYLRGNLVKRKYRDQADHATRGSCRYSNQIGISQWLEARKAEHTPADHLKRSDITHGIKRARMDARLQRLCCAQNTTVLLKNSDCSFEP
jgi:hypothetical protein